MSYRQQLRTRSSPKEFYKTSNIRVYWHSGSQRLGFSPLPCQHRLLRAIGCCGHGRLPIAPSCRHTQQAAGILSKSYPSPEITAEEQAAPHLLQSFVATLSAASLLAGSVLMPAPALSNPLLTEEEQLNIFIFKRSTPSVVNITNLAVKRDAFTMNMLKIPQGQGSGFIWDYEGHVVTNYHVIKDASDIRVTLDSGEEYPARVVGVDQDKDIAVLQIGTVVAGPDGELLLMARAEGEWPTGQQPQLPQDMQVVVGEGADAGEGSEVADAGTEELDMSVLKQLDLKPLNRCSSSANIVVGQKVYAIGNPFGLDHTLTVGVVSGTGREIGSMSDRPIEDGIQTDAAINPGNSGGPLLDSGNCLIGINTAILAPTGVNNGVGFAVPVDTVKNSVGQIIKYGKVTRPIMGIAFAPDVSSEALGIKAGILVLDAREGGPSWKAGLKGCTRDEYGRLVLGDIIVAVNGVKMKKSSDLYRVLDKCRVGDVLRITVLREKSTFEVDVTLEAKSSLEPGSKQQPGSKQEQQPQPNS